MARVGIVMGSDSDLPVMSRAAEVLEKLGCRPVAASNIMLKPALLKK